VAQLHQLHSTWRFGSYDKYILLNSNFAQVDKKAAELELEEVEALKAAAAKEEQEKGKGKEAWVVESSIQPRKKGCLPKRKAPAKPAEGGSIPFLKFWQYSSNFNICLVLYVTFSSFHS
jgi:hypothetical protein